MRKTPLNATHRASGAKMVPFGGWDMPVEYSGLISEHMAVRKAAGLFDVSHMGEFEVEGPGALAFLQRTTANNVAKLVDGQAQYSAFPLANGARRRRRAEAIPGAPGSRSDAGRTGVAAPAL